MKLTSDHASYTYRVMQYAGDEDDSSLVLVSAVGSQSACKSLAAHLNQNAEVKFTFPKGLPVTRTSGAEATAFGSRKKKGQGRYRVQLHRLGPGTHHVVALLKDPGFMPCVSESAVWNELQSDRFTTPLLRAWLPRLMETLQEQGAIRRYARHECEAGMMTLTGEDLDLLVKAGVRDGSLAIPEEVA